MATTSSINPVTGQPITTTGTSTTSTSGTNTLSSQDFMNLMITQLQNQDPLDPTDSNALLQQIAEISTLQSNTALQTSLTGLTLQQSIGAAGNLLGKAVQGVDANNNQVSGNVVGVTVQNQQVSLTLDSGSVLPMQNITVITQPVAAAATAATTPAAATTTTPATATPASTAASNIVSAITALTG